MQTVFWDPEGRAVGEEPCADEFAYLNACTALRDPARPETCHLNNVVTLHELQFRPSWSAELHGWEDLREAKAAGYSDVQMWRVCMYMEYCEEGATSASFEAHTVALRSEPVATSPQRASAKIEPGERLLAMICTGCGARLQSPDAVDIEAHRMQALWTAGSRLDASSTTAARRCRT